VSDEPPPEDPYFSPTAPRQPPPQVWRRPLGGTRPPPDRPVQVRVAEFILGLVACLGLALLAVVLFSRGDLLSVAGPLVIVALNFVAISVPAMMGHKSFSAGFATGYGVILLIGIIACFAFLEI
jgi:hypothetical protein